MKCALTTLGCKVNQCETDALAEAMKAAGFEIVPFEEQADVVIVNTCCVTAEGERKSRQIVRRAAQISPNARIAVTGCAAERDPEQFASLSQVALVVGNAQKRDIPRLLAQDGGQKIVREDLPAPHAPAPEAQTEKTRAFLKIQDGCDNFCTYCVIPYVRGRECSCPIDQVLEKANCLARMGFYEIVLTGIRLSSYGKEWRFTPSLTDVTEQVCRIPGIERVRLGSIEPDVITPQMLDRLFALEPFCRHFHLSLQSGCDSVLKRMHRHYTASDILASIDLIRSRDPLCALTADVIVGFPGETEEDFLQTLSLVETVGFAFVHVFPYSERAGTAAAVMKDAVPKKVRHERVRRLQEICRKSGETFRRRFVGQTVPVLVENCRENVCTGLSDRYLPVRFTGFDTENTIVPVRITGISEDGLIGERMNDHG